MGNERIQPESRWNSQPCILDWLNNVLTKSEQAARKQGKTFPVGAIARMRSEGETAIRNGDLRGDISEKLRALPGGELLTDLYL